MLQINYFKLLSLYSHINSFILIASLFFGTYIILHLCNTLTQAPTYINHIDTNSD